MSKGRRNFHSTYPLYLFVVGIHTKETSNFVRSAEGACVCNRRPSGANNRIWLFVSSVRSSYSHPDLLLITTTTPLFQIKPVLNTGLSLSEPLQLHKGYNAI